MEKQADLELTAALVVGDQRERARESLAHLLRQTAIESIEIIVLDLSPAMEPVAGVEHPAVRYIARTDIRTYPEARAECARQARGEIVAFVEDHCFTSERWAEALIRAYRNPVDIVNYAFDDSRPVGYMARAFLFLQYGRWMVPARRGPLSAAAGSNVSYRRRALEPFFDDLAGRLEVEYTLQREIQRRGGVIWMEPDAVVCHNDWSRFRDGCWANGAFRRMFAGSRVEQERWGLAARLFYAAAMPAVPPLHLWRLGWSVRNRPQLWGRFLVSLPVAMAVYAYASYQEALGYLFGPGASREQFRDVELFVDRRA